MDLGLAGKVALVTGSSRGIGRAIAQRLAEEGARVALCARSQDELEQAGRSLQQAGADVYWRACDIGDAGAVAHLVEAVSEQFGGLDILVANSGAPPRGQFLEFTDDDWRRVFETANMGTVRLVREAIPRLLQRGGGSILTITSSSVKQPIAGQWLSNMMRPGVAGLVKSLANEYAQQNIRVNNIAPGRVLTERNLENDRKRAEREGVSLEEAQKPQLARMPMRRFGSPEEIADAAAFLVSERASYITGVTLHVDGGMVGSL